MTKIDCTKCDGTGYLKGFSHIRGGICFSCMGTGKKAAPRKRKSTEQKQLERQLSVMRANAAAWTIRQLYRGDPRLTCSDDNPHAYYQYWDLARADGLASIIHKPNSEWE